MSEKDVVTRNVRILDILPGEPPRLLTGEWLYCNGKRIKLFQQMVHVPDTEIFARFTSQVNKRDTVQVTVTAE